MSVLLAWLLVPLALHSQVVGSTHKPNFCLAPSELSADLVDEYAELMTRKDDMAVQILEIGALKRVRPTQVKPVNDLKTCQKAAASYAKDLNRPVARVHVIQVGRRYMVIDPDFHSGEWKTLSTFDAKFTRILSRVAY